MSDLASHLHDRSIALRNAQAVFGADFWTSPLDEPVPDWLVPGLLQRAALHVLTSESGACKSWLGLELFLSGVYGIPVLRQVPPVPFSSIYLAADSPKWDIGQQMRKLMLAHELKRDENPTSFVLPAGLLLDEKKHVDSLAQLAYHWDIDALFIDVMLYVHNQNENDNGAMARTVLRAAKFLRDELGLAVFFLHHNSKPQPDRPEGFRGAGTIVQAAEHHFALNPHKSSIDLTVKKIRGDKVLPRTLSFCLAPRNGGAFLDRLEQEPEGPDPILALLSERPRTRAVLGEVLSAQGWTPRRIDNRLQYLRAQAHIQTNGEGEWQLSEIQPESQ